MTNTPEGKVKRRVSALLKSVPGLWYDMPVPSGFGGSTLDYIGCYRGQFFAVETKRPGGKPTERQLAIISRIKAAGGVVFVVDGELSELESWLRGADR
jgi:hypothetical protein